MNLKQKLNVYWSSLVAQSLTNLFAMLESACNAEDWGSGPESGRSPGEGNGNPLLYSSLENPMDRGPWLAAVHGVARVGHDLATKPPQMYFTGFFKCKKQQYFS